MKVCSTHLINVLDIFLNHPNASFWQLHSLPLNQKPEARIQNVVFSQAPLADVKLIVQFTAATVDLVDASPQTSIRSWKNSDVLNWLKEVGLQGRLVFFLDLVFIFSDLGRVWENYT